MKKAVAYGALLIMALVLGTGCATTVTVRHMAPADVNMAAYRNLAVQSVEAYRFDIFSSPSSVVSDLSGTSPVRVYSGFNAFAQRNTARYATRELVEKLDDTGYFTLLTPPLSDVAEHRFPELARMGFNAVLTARVSHLDVDEYIFARQVKLETEPDDTADPEEQTVLRHYLTQKVSLSISYAIVDTDTGRTIVSDTLTDRRERTVELDADGPQIIQASSMQLWLNAMVDDFVDSIVTPLVPRWVSSSVKLMANKPKVERVQEAYEYVERGNPGVARTIFLREWEESRHIPSGYNAALIMESLGMNEEAIRLMEEVWIYSGNRTVEAQLNRMRRARDDHAYAQSQF